MPPGKKHGRKQQILETLALQLEMSPGRRITTAHLAVGIGISEAALYRHFPSKSSMFDALIDFSEDAVFGAIQKILADGGDTVSCCRRIVQTVLVFSERNPGITCILIGGALVGEDQRLRNRVMKFFDRLETQFKQILRETKMNDSVVLIGSIDAIANQMLSFIVGKMSNFTRTTFRDKPTQYYQQQWQALHQGLFET